MPTTDGLTRIPVLENWECIQGHTMDNHDYPNEIFVRNPKSQVEIKAALESLGKRLIREANTTAPRLKGSRPSCTLCAAANDLWLWVKEPYPRVIWKEPDIRPRANKQKSSGTK